MILATCQCQHIFCCWVEPSLLLSSLGTVWGQLGSFLQQKPESPNKCLLYSIFNNYWNESSDPPAFTAWALHTWPWGTFLRLRGVGAGKVIITFITAICRIITSLFNNFHRHQSCCPPLHSFIIISLVFTCTSSIWCTKKPKSFQNLMAGWYILYQQEERPFLQKKMIFLHFPCLATMLKKMARAQGKMR